MDRYKKLMCVKGLVISLEEQLYQYFQKNIFEKDIKIKIIDSYYDAILEQLSETEKQKKSTIKWPEKIVKIKETDIKFKKEDV